MLSRALSASLLVSMLAGSSTAAIALEPVWKFAEPRSTPVSGFTGRLQVIQLDKSRNQGVTSVKLSERKDRPCKLVLGPKNLSGNSTQSENDNAYSDNESNKCDGNAKDTISAGFPKSSSTDRSRRYYVRGIATCDSKNAANRRVKGIRVVAAKVWQTKREVEELATTDSEQQKHCDGDWHDTVYCDPGHVAIGVNAHWSSEDAIVGLGLRCGYLSWLN